jgi:hypothetical protein
MDNTSFNYHVDICLNKVEVKSILKTQMGDERVTDTLPSAKISTKPPSSRVRKKGKR